jgi:hypothetical protein
MFSAFSMPAAFANAEAPIPPTGPQPGGSEGAKPEDNNAGKGTPSNPDIGTGKTVDYRKMVMDLLGLGEDADEAKVSEAFNACMAMEPDAETKAIKGKLSEATLAVDKSEAGKAQALADKAAVEKANEELKAKIDSQEKLAANETARAVAAEGAFANERNAHSKTIVACATKMGLLSKADADKKVVELANAKTDTEFSSLATETLSGSVKIQVNSMVGELGRTIAPGTAGEKFTAMVNESMKADSDSKTKTNFDFHWSKVCKSSEGQAVLASMRQPQKYEEHKRVK